MESGRGDGGRGNGGRGGRGEDQNPERTLSTRERLITNLIIRREVVTALIHLVPALERGAEPDDPPGAEIAEIT